MKFLPVCFVDKNPRNEVNRDSFNQHVDHQNSSGYKENTSFQINPLSENKCTEVSKQVTQTNFSFAVKQASAMPTTVKNKPVGHR